MRSLLSKLVDEQPADPVRESREAVVQSLPVFLSVVEETSAMVGDLRLVLEAAKHGADSGEFALTTWRAMLPALRKLREEAVALERALMPPVHVAAYSRKKKRHH